MARKTFWSLWVHQRGDKRYHSAPGQPAVLIHPRSMGRLARPIYSIDERCSMSNLPQCPQCSSEFTYEDGSMYVCPECAHEWSQTAVEETEESA